MWGGGARGRGTDLASPDLTSPARCVCFREREEAAEAIRHVRNQALLAPFNPLGSSDAATTGLLASRIEAPLEELLAHVARCARRGGGADDGDKDGSGGAGWAATVLPQLKVAPSLEGSWLASPTACAPTPASTSAGSSGQAW